MTERESQNADVLRHLQEIGTITSWEAVRQYNITRLSARIWDLRHAGHDITTVIVYGKNSRGRPTHWASYSLRK